jgi:hypothetical protein
MVFRALHVRLEGHNSHPPPACAGRNVGEIGVVSQGISWDAADMRILIVEPSPLAQNVYRLLVRSRYPDARVVTLEALVEIGDLADDTPFDAAVIASGALDGYGARFRGLLTDVTHWQRLPKLVVTRPGSTGVKAAWSDLPNATTIARPFRERDFVGAVTDLLESE